MEQGSQEWLDWRRQGLGGSDAYVVMGLVPQWKTPYQLWEEKVGLRAEPEANFAMKRGSDLEEKARAKYELDTGIDMPPVTIEHPKIPFLRASLDGFNDGDNPEKKRMILEIKCPMNKDDHEMALKGKVPEKYLVQIMHQFLVTKADIAHYYSFDGQDGVIVPVKPKEKLMEEIFFAEEEFWERVEKKVPPPLLDTDYYQLTGQGAITLFEKLQEAKQNLEIAKGKFELLKAEVLKLCNKPRFTCNGVKVIKYEKKGSIDYKKVPELKSVDLEQFRKASSEVTTFRFPE